jgi:hypothetical protein
MSRLMKNLLLPAACVSMLLLAAGPAASANMLTNPGFEAGLSGWTAFGNAYPETSNPPAVVPLSGTGVAKMFGNFSGGFDVTGIFQSFAAVPGNQYQMSSNARHWSGDPLTGIGAGSCATGCSDNWVVQKIRFKDAANLEIGPVESIILDGTYATDVWHAAAPITAIAPAGTVSVEAFILFIQPAGHPGSAQFDNVEFLDVTSVPTQPATWGQVKNIYR